MQRLGWFKWKELRHYGLVKNDMALSEQKCKVYQRCSARYFYGKVSMARKHSFKGTDWGRGKHGLVHTVFTSSYSKPIFSVKLYCKS